MNPRPRYLQIPMAVICNSDLQALDLKVYGVVHWYCHMSKQKCVASNEVIAGILSCEERKVNPKSVSNSVSRLEKAGCVQVALKPNKKRVEIIPLVTDEPIADEEPASDFAPSNDGAPVEKSVPLNDGRKIKDMLNVPSDDGRELKGVPSNDAPVFHQTMSAVPSDDGQKKNIEQEDMKKNNSSYEELQHLAAEAFGDDEVHVKREGAQSEALEGEVVQLGKDGRPLKPKREPNPDSSYGNLDINEGMGLLAELLGTTPTKERLNRFALQRLYEKYGKNQTLEKMRDAFAVRSDRYAPKILNYMDLWDKWEDLKLYFERKKGGARIGNISTDATYDNVVGGIAW